MMQSGVVKSKAARIACASIRFPPMGDEHAVNITYFPVK